MPGFTPGRRWQPAYFPFKKETFGDRALRVIEYSVKGPLFGCRMCGNCLLQETALICPMECPKGLRNGPCGGSKYHPPAYADPASNLERRLVAGEFVVTSEITPPLSSNTDRLIHHIEAIKPCAAALNFTDNQSATPRKSSWACSKLAIEHGGEPVLQMSARNRSRGSIAILIQPEIPGSS